MVGLERNTAIAAGLEPPSTPSNGHTRTAGTSQTPRSDYSSPAAAAATGGTQPTVRGLLSGMSMISMVSDSSAGNSGGGKNSPNRKRKNNKRRGGPETATSSSPARSQHAEPFDWFRGVHLCVQSGRWDTLRELLTLRVQEASNSKNDSATSGSSRKKVGFWRRMVSGSGSTNGVSESTDASTADRPVFLQQDKNGLTVLHAALTHSTTPADVLLLMIQVEPQAASIHNAKGRLPLHTAVWYGHHMEVVAELVEAYPAAIGTADGRGQTPLAYAMANAVQQTNLELAPSSFWMPVTPEDHEEEDERESQPKHGTSPEALWQENAVERWAVVHWLLLASATYPQTSLTVGGQKPMLVEALVFAAPPAVVSLLIGASVVLLSYEKKASAFAGTTLYTCIARQYPSSILMSLALQCPADVRGVADETGMGLIAAQFVVGCFQRRNDATDEWALVEDIWMAIQETIMEGQLPDEAVDPALVDWWAKIEFLICFCSPTPELAQALSASSKSELRKYLLHQAAINPDVPPTVLRLLLALYPQSAALSAPADLGSRWAGALPLILVAQTPEYLPRNYELPIMTSENSLDIVLQSRPQAAWEAHRGRLPLHWAIAAGKSYASMQGLVELDADRMLRIQDPETNLYPFLLAAYIYGVNGLGRLPKEHKEKQKQLADDPSEPTGEGFDAPDRMYLRWTRMARNQYTHYVWKGLSERQKAAAVYRVIQSRSVSGFSTIWQLLLQTPDLVPQSPFKRVPTNSARDERGVGTVANHYLSWCYPTTAVGRNQIQGDPIGFNEDHWKVLREAIRTAPSGGLANLPTDFEKWFNKMRFWIRYCCPANPAVRRGNAKSLRVDPRWDCPGNDDDYLLHMAVMNPDTPPVVVALLLGTNPVSATKPIPNSRFLPLHISCRTPLYVPRFFEAPYDSCIKILTRGFPEAAQETDDDEKLPLHRAIEARKPWSDIQTLVQAYPQSLLIRVPDSRLFPFQQMAMPKLLTRVQRLNTQYKARNGVETELWESYSPLEKVEATRDERKREQLDVLTSIFELFRRNVSMVEPSSNEEVSESAHIEQEETVEEECTDSSESTLNVPGLNVTSHTDFEIDDDMTENDTIYTGVGNTEYSATNTFVDTGVSEEGAGEEVQPSGPTGPTDDSESSESLESYLPAGSEPSALMNFLSGHERTQSKQSERSVFDCDASVLSNVDVLSTLSSTLHSTLHSTRHQATKKETGRRYSMAGKGFDSEHGRVSEGGEEPSENDGKAADDSDSDSSSSGSGYEFAGDSSAYLSFAISDGSGRMSLDDDGLGDVSIGVDSDAVSFASAAVQSEVSENSEDSSSSSLVHFQMRRKQRVEYWEDRDTLDPVRVTKQNLQLRTDDISSVYSANPSTLQGGSDSISSAQQSFLAQNSDSMSSAQQSLLNQGSLSSMSATDKVDSSPMSKSVSLRSMKSTGVDSYVSLQSQDLMQNSITDMVWMPDDLVTNRKLLGGQDSSREFDDSMLVGLSSSKPFLTGLSGLSEGNSKSINSDSLESETNTSFQETFHQEDDDVGPSLVNLIQIQDGDSQTTEEDADLQEQSESTETNDETNVSESKMRKESETTDAKRDADESSSSDSSDGVEGSESTGSSIEVEDSKTVGEKKGGLNETDTTNRQDAGRPEAAEGGTGATELHDAGEKSKGGEAGKFKSTEESRPQVLTPKKSTDTLRRFLLTASQQESDSEFGPRPNLDDSGHSEGSINLDEVFSSNASQASKASKSSSKIPKKPEITVSSKLQRDKSDKASSDEPNSLTRDVPGGPILKQDKLDSSNSSHDDAEGEDATKIDCTGSNKGETKEVVYFDRKEMRWKKKIVNEPEPLPMFPKAPAKTPSGEKPAEPQSPSKKKEMYFDRKSMRWRVRDATGENSARNLETSLSSIDENREASHHPMVPTIPARRGSQSGSPFVELASTDKKAMNSSPIKSKPPPQKRISVKVHLGSIPEKRSGKSLLTSKNMTCLLCNKNPREVLLKPCQHLSICRVCSKEYKEIAMCPLCEELVTDRMLIF